MRRPPLRKPGCRGGVAPPAHVRAQKPPLSHGCAVPALPLTGASQGCRALGDSIRTVGAAMRRKVRPRARPKASPPQWGFERPENGTVRRMNASLDALRALQRERAGRPPSVARSADRAPPGNQIAAACGLAMTWQSGSSVFHAHPSLLPNHRRRNSPELLKRRLNGGMFFPLTFVSRIFTCSGNPARKRAFFGSPRITPPSACG